MGYEQHDVKNKKTDNSRNGYSSKNVNTSYGKVDIEVPRDRKSEFQTELIKKHKKDITGIEEKVISMYAKGMTVRDIQAHIFDIYGLEISPTAVSNMTEKVLQKANEWQNRPLNSIYTICFLDAIFLKLRHEGRVINTAIYAVIGIDLDGIKNCLGLWISSENETSKFWLSVLNDLKNRGVEDILIFSIDGLPGFPDAIKAAFPESEIQRCIVHQIRNSLKYVPYKDRKKVVSDLKLFYKAVSEEKGLNELENFEEKWNSKYPNIANSWRRNWGDLATFFKYPEEIRRLIYTTNPIESFNRGLKKVSKNRSVFPNKEAIFKLLYLAVKDTTKRWTTKIKNWGLIIAQLSIYFEERLSKYL